MLVINKIDALPVFDFRKDYVEACAKRLNPQIKIVYISAKTGEGVKELADYQEIVSSRRKKTGFQQIAGCVNSQKIHLAKALSDGFEYRVIVFSSEEKAKQAFHS